MLGSSRCIEGGRVEPEKAVARVGTLDNLVRMSLSGTADMRRGVGRQKAPCLLRRGGRVDGVEHALKLVGHEAPQGYGEPARVQHT